MTAITDPRTVRHASESELAAGLAAAEQAGAAVLVLFSATWCQPCQQLHPELDRYAAEAPDHVRVIAVDADDEPALTAHYGVDAFPTLLLFVHDEPVLRTSAPRTSEQLHEAIDEFAARALASDARTRYPLGGRPAAPARTVLLPDNPGPGFAFSVESPLGGGGRAGVTIEADEPRGALRRLSVMSGWGTVVRIYDVSGERAAGLLAQLGTGDVDEAVLVVSDVSEQLVPALRRFDTLRRLRVESAVLAERPLTDFAALRRLDRLDLNTMGAAVDQGELQRLRISLPDTVVNGTWMAAHLRRPVESEA